MFEIRIHGRGGQGAVTAAAMLAVAAFQEGSYAQAFPTFGSERTGAPVVSFCRIDQQPIRIHEPISSPDALIVQDPTLVHHVRLLDGVGPDTFVLINTSRTLEEIGLGDLTVGRSPNHARCIPATDLAREILGRPLPNTALLGGFAAQTGLVSIDAIASAIRATFASAVAERNVKVAEAAFRFVREAEGRLADA